MNNKKLLSLALCSSILVSCGGGGGGGGGSVKGKSGEPLETELAGTYQAVFSPLNKTVSGHLNGSLTIVREKDDVVVDVRFSNGPMASMHSQNIHVGDRCPTEDDDLNRDGYIDAEETALVVKEILIPLDDDLTSQFMGLGTFPVSDDFGYYFWSRATPFEKLMDDLRLEDINPVDEYVKLNSNKSLTMIGKVVLVRGVPETTPLPETVLGKGRLTPRQGIPVACGIIKRLGQAPGVIDQDRTDIPVPTGETIGGSSGVDDGANFPSTQTAAGAGTGNYGDDDDVIPTTTTGGTNGSNRVEPEVNGSETTGGLSF
jgi:hypothetical protein